MRISFLTCQISEYKNLYFKQKLYFMYKLDAVVKRKYVRLFYYIRLIRIYTRGFKWNMLNNKCNMYYKCRVPRISLNFIITYMNWRAYTYIFAV